MTAHHLALIHFSLRKYYPTLNHKELMYSAYVGYNNALRLFKPDKGMTLESFIVQKVRYAVLDEIRIPRAKSRQVSHVDVDWTEEHEGMQTSHDPWGELDNKIDLDLQKRKMDERRKRVLHMFECGMNQREIGDVLGVTESRICQIIRGRKKFKKAA